MFPLSLDQTLFDQVFVDHKAFLDHSVLTSYLYISKLQSVKKNIISGNLKEIDLNAFKTDIISTLGDSDTADPETLKSGLVTVLDNHTPLKSREVTARPSPKWFNSDIKSAKRRRR